MVTPKFGYFGVVFLSGTATWLEPVVCVSICHFVCAIESECGCMDCVCLCVCERKREKERLARLQIRPHSLYATMVPSSGSEIQQPTSVLLIMQQTDCSYACLYSECKECNI